jgi:hypothetical protein
VRWWNIPAVLKTGEGIVPSHECSQESKQSSCLLKSKLSTVVAQVVGIVLACKQEEADVEKEEEREEGEGGLEGADEEKRCEDPPAGKEEAHDRTSITLVRTIGAEDVPCWRQEKTIGDPEASI